MEDNKMAEWHRLHDWVNDYRRQHRLTVWQFLSGTGCPSSNGDIISLYPWSRNNWGGKSFARELARARSEIEAGKPFVFPDTDNAERADDTCCAELHHLRAKGIYTLFFRNMDNGSLDSDCILNARTQITLEAATAFIEELIGMKCSVTLMHCLE